VGGGEVLALGVEVDERVGDGEAEREEPEAEGNGVGGCAEREKVALSANRTEVTHR
jgi:hypothetical protein